MARILAIETSCDETAAAVVEDRSKVLSSIVASQVDVHRRFGGVVPELASRRHVEAIGPVIGEALEAAGCAFDDLDAIAVTYGPGLVGALLVGVSTAKAIAWQRRLPLVGVNHLEGHVRSVFIENPDVDFPALALVVSGGHTALYLCPEEGVYRPVARTRDDAAGEAFDKVAKLLGLGYPGGPLIDRLSRDGDDRAVRFPKAQMKDGSLDFSFSGLKTAVRRYARAHGLDHARPVGGEVSDAIRDLVASFQKAVVDALLDRVFVTAEREAVQTVLLSGGVACNSRLRTEFRRAGSERGIRVAYPSPEYTTDNAAMIAAAAFLRFERGVFEDLDLNATPDLRLAPRIDSTA